MGHLRCVPDSENTQGRSRRSTSAASPLCVRRTNRVVSVGARARACGFRMRLARLRKQPVGLDRGFRRVCGLYACGSSWRTRVWHRSWVGGRVDEGWCSQEECADLVAGGDAGRRGPRWSWLGGRVACSDGVGSRFGRVREASWASGGLWRSCRGDDAKGAAFAVGAAVRVAPGETAQEVFPGFAGSGSRGGRSG